MHSTLHTLRGLVLVMLVWMSGSAQAAVWQICDYRVQVLEHVAHSRTMFVKVLSAQRHAKAECSPAGTLMGFRPSTRDYQSELPRRRWPQPGSSVTVRHRYLDGQCKNIGACRIQHYSPLLN